MNKQNGSAHVVIIVVLVVALLGTLGFVFWQNFINRETMTKTESVAVPEKKTENKSDTTAPANLTADKVNDIVGSVYKTYISERKKGTTVAASLTTIENHFTDSAYAKLQKSVDVEGLTCASNYVPDSVTIETTIEGNSASSEVTRVLYGDTASARIQVITDITTGKISAVSCPS